ncbi:tetratricopeptide repeat protein [Variovorax rhizosphaerae]|uniref:Tetratricopeptide repeat protein n=1 Tax=Variovorax rhizosphaerae TaxID=1836200 RepID=A0ABU8WKQ2_9BURK
MKHRRTAATLILLGLALPSFALTIGRPQGTAWIGKPLDLVIPLTLGDSEGNSLCIEGEVVQGDTRIDDKRVTLSLEPGASAAAPRLHVRTTVAIEEPVVNVTVRAGCDARSNRTFVLLADVPVESASLPSASRFGAAPLPSTGSSMDPGTADRGGRGGRGAGGGEFGSSAGSPPPVRRPAARPTPRTADAGAAPSAPPAPPRRVIAAQAPVVRPAPAPKPAPPPVAAAPAAPVVPPPVPAAAPESPPAGPRLKLEALDPALTRDGGLKTSSELKAPATEDLAKRAEAAAQWRALAAPPEDAQRESQRIQSLEATLAALRELTAQNQRALLEMRSELADARDSRYRNPLVYALGVLLALALLAIGLLWRMTRRNTAPAWWGEGFEPRPASSGRPALPADSKFAEEDDEREPTQPAPLRGRELDPRHAALLAATNADTTYGPTGVPVVAPIEIAATRPVNTEELFDVQQQSDFFLSLGQHDQAIAVLVEHIAASPDTSALAYLDLFKIYHSLGRRDEYAKLATDFERAFNAEVPEFDEFSLGGRGLEHYRSALARIESQWPTAGTLALIEELVFRKPGVHEDEAFDLAAYQELLLLYAIAKEVVDPDTAPAPITPIPFVDTLSHETQPTARATLMTEPAAVMVMPAASIPAPALAPTKSPSMPNAPIEPFPSLYGAIDAGLHAQTDISALEPSAQPPVNLDLAQFDKTAFETIAAPIEAPAPTATAAIDPHIIDFELFDPETEAEIAPRRIIKR